MEKEEENQIKETSLNEPTATMNDKNDSELEEKLETETETETSDEDKRGYEKRGENSLAIHLGDILRILSPSNLKYHDKMFLVDYCGKDLLRIVDVESGFPYELKLIGKNNSEFEEKEGIFSIELLSREKFPGYARQNGLVVGVWVDVEFGGELPFLVSGLITNLEEDQIEITLWPNQEVIYLDFRYEGLYRIEPKIEKIQIREAPSLEAEQLMEQLREESRKRGDELDGLVDGEQEEMENLSPSLEMEEAETNQLEKLREESLEGKAFAKSIIPEIEYEEVLGNYYQRVEQRKEDIRYSLNAQIEDFLNELLSTIPNFMRTPKVMEEVEHTLSRFRELHEMYARMNNSGVVVGYRSNRYRGKPLVSSILDTSDESGRGKWIRNTGWILPVVYLRKKGWHDLILEDGDETYDATNNDEDGYFNEVEKKQLYDNGSNGNEWIENPACVWLKGIQQSIDKWIQKSGTKTGGNGGYRRLLQELDEAMRPCSAFTKEQVVSNTVVGKNEGDESLSEKMIGPYDAGVPLEAIIDNTPFRIEGVFGNIENDGFYSTVSKGGNGDKLTREDVILSRRRFVIQKHVDSVSLLTMNWTNSGKKMLERETVIENEKMVLKSVVFLPEAWMAFSRISLPGTDILTRVRLGSWWPQLSRVLNRLTAVDNVVVDDLTKDLPYNGVAETRCVVRGKGKARVGGSTEEEGEGKGKGNHMNPPLSCDEPCVTPPCPNLGSGGGGAEEGAIGEFLTGVREYVLAKENIKSTGTVSKPLETLLNTVIPNNLYLIDFMCPYLSGGEYSLKHYGQLLEPFGVYLWNMRYAESYVMQKKIRDKIAEYRVHMETERKEYDELKQYFKKNGWGMNYRNSERFFHWFRSRGEEFMSSFLEWYHLNIGALSTSEVLSRVYSLDDGRLMNTITAYFHYALITLDRFTKKGGTRGSGDSLWNWEEGENGGIMRINGGKRKLAKRYNSLSELHEDDHRTDLYWDKALDTSPYYLEEQYGGETGGVVGGENGEKGGAIGIALKINEIKQTLDEDGVIGGDNENHSMANEEGAMGENQEGGGLVRQSMRQKLSASEYLEYLAMNLKDRHFCPAEQAVELASILISGKRPVKEGEYASVHLGGGDVGYYKRRHHTWERDTQLDFSKEGTDEKAVFSNLEKVGGGLGVRYGGGGSGKKGEILEEREIATLSGDPEEAKRIMKWEEKKLRNKYGGAAGEDENAKKQKDLEKEMFQQKIQQSLKELEAMFEKSMKTQIDRTVRIYSLKQSEAKRANSFAYYLGKYKKEIEARASPHASLLELILEEPDFDLKQKYIVRFYNAFCREPILNGGIGAMGLEEKIYWKYCSETNVPLLPTSYYDLAMEYMRGGDYGELLEILCSTVGDKSSDGEAIIDKYTGRVLKKLDLDIEEGFDEMGFQRKTREIMTMDDSEARREGAMNNLGESSAAEGTRVNEEERRKPEKDMEDIEEEEGEYLNRINESLTTRSGTSMIATATTTASQAKVKTAQDYGDGENESIARVGLYMLQEMGLFGSEEIVENVLGFVIQIVSELLSNKEFIETEKRFEQKRKLALEKGKTFPFTSYEVYKNQKLLYATLGSILVGVQTITSEVKMTRNYSSCIRSLRGYPTGLGGSGKEDKSALRYIACLLLQQQSDEAPWNARNTGKKEETHMNICTEYIDKFLLGNRVVEDRIGAKKAYEIENGMGMEEGAVDITLRLEKQINLLPPMERRLYIDDRQIMPVSREFLEEWKVEIRRSLKLSSGEKGGMSDGVVRAKLMVLGSALFEQVNRDITGKVRELLMQSALGVPYLENACCQSRGAEEGAYPLGYFVKKNPLIGKILKTSRVLERALERAENGKKSVLLYHDESTRIGNGEFWDRGNGSSYFKANIYAALIHYFHYDRPLLPVPEYLRGSIYEEPPKNYPIGGLLKEKIEFLEKAGRHYDVEKLQHCLMLVGQQNILSGGAEGEGVLKNGEEENGTKIGEALGDFLTSSVFEMAPGESSGVYGTLLQKLTDVFREWKRGTMQNSTSPKIRALNAFLAKSNATMFEHISKEWRPTSDKERQLLAFLERIQVWNLAGDIERESLNRANSDSLQQIVRFIKDMCSMFSFVYSKRIEVMQEFKTKGIKALPKHWGFDVSHYQLLSDYIRNTFGSLIRKRDETDNVLFVFFEKLAMKEEGLFRQLRRLLSFFPVFTPLSLVVGENGEREVFYSLFPKETCYGVHVFCLYLILTRFVEISQSYEIMNLDVQSRKKERLWQQEQRGEMDGERGIVVSMEDALEEKEKMSEGAVENYSIAIQETAEDRQVWEGKRSVLKEKIRQFIYDCLEVERDNKQVVDMSYEELRKKQDETEKREKKRITDRLKEMEMYERRVENQMKDLKLGNWNVGQQKGLFQYDKETFKREMMEQQYDMVPGAMEASTEEGAVFYDTERMDLGEDYLNGEEADRLRDMELNGEILAMGEDWDDGGEYY